MKPKTTLTSLIALGLILLASPAAHATLANNTQQVTSIPGTIGTLTNYGVLPESQNRVSFDIYNRDTYLLYSRTLSGALHCYLAISADYGVTWSANKDVPKPTDNGSHPFTSCAIATGRVTGESILYVVIAHAASGDIGTAINVDIDIGLLPDGGSVSWVSGSPFVIAASASTESFSYPTIVLDRNGYLFVAFSVVHDDVGTVNDYQNDEVCASGTTNPTANPTWTCSSPGLTCVVGTTCPFAALTESNIDTNKELPVLLATNFDGHANPPNTIITRGLCSGSETVKCHAPSAAPTTELSNRVFWNATTSTLVFDSTPASFSLANPSSAPADQRSLSAASDNGDSQYAAFLAYADGTNVYVRTIIDPYNSWGGRTTVESGATPHGVHETWSDAGTTSNVEIWTTVFETSTTINATAYQGGLLRTGGGIIYTNSTTPYYPTSPAVFLGGARCTPTCGTKNINLPVAWVNQASTRELWATGVNATLLGING